MSNELLSVWNEVTISQSGIGITLYSESRGEQAKVEDETWFTFDELQSLSGDIVNLRLSDDTRTRLVSNDPQEIVDEMRSQVSNLSNAQVSNLPEEGDLLWDENAPDWNDGGAVVVEEVLEEVQAREYVIEGPNEGTALAEHLHQLGDKTVADENLQYPEDDAVVIARYAGSEKEYAFPVSRLK